MENKMPFLGKINCRDFWKIDYHLQKYEVVESLNSTDEYCVFLKHDSSRVMESLYSAIRNALAHGSFLMKKRRGTNMYFFAN